MSGAFYINLFIIFLLSFVFGPHVFGLPAVAGMPEMLKKSVVQVLSFGLTEGAEGLVLDASQQKRYVKGTGFCVDAQKGYFVTNKHVANLMQYALPQILSFSGKILKARVVYEDPFYDFVILKAEANAKADAFNPAEFEALPLADCAVNDFLNPQLFPKNNKYWVCSTRSQDQAAIDAPIQTPDTLYEAGYRNLKWDNKDFIYCREIGTPGGHEFEKCLNIKFQPSQGAGRCIKGDSGSAILDDVGRVVAVQWGSLAHQGGSLSVPVAFVKQALNLLAANPHYANPSQLSAQEVCVWKSEGNETLRRLLQVRPATLAEAANFNLRAGEMLINLSTSAMQAVAHSAPGFVKNLHPRDADAKPSSHYARLVAINGVDLRRVGSVEATLAAIQKIIWDTQSQIRALGAPVSLELQLESFYGNRMLASFTYHMEAVAPQAENGFLAKDLILQFSCPKGKPSFRPRPDAAMNVQLPLFVPEAPTFYRVASTFSPQEQVRSGGGGGAAAGPSRASAPSLASSAGPAQQAQKELQDLRALYSKTTSKPQRLGLVTAMGQLSTTQRLLQRAQRELVLSPRAAKLSPSTQKAIQAQIAALTKSKPALAAQRVLVQRQVAWLGALSYAKRL